MQNRGQWIRSSLAVLLSSGVLGSFEARADANAYVASTTADVVSVIDTATDEVLAEIPVGMSPARVAVAQDGTRAYVTNTGSDSLSVIDTTTNAVVAIVPLAAAPYAVAVTPNGAEVYVVASEGVLQVIDTALIGTASDPVITTISFGQPNFLQGAASVTILPDGSRAYAVVSGAVHVIDTATHAVLNTLYVGTSPSQLAFSPDGTRAYITNSYGSTFTGFNFLGQLIVLDTVTDAVLNDINLWSLPASIVVTPDGSHAYIALAYRFRSSYASGFIPDRYVAVVDLEANALSTSILLPSQPGGVAVTPDGSVVYVAIPGDDSISVIDTATDTLVSPINVAAGPSGLAIGPAPALAECENGLDDDGDGLVDYPADPGCGIATAGLENPACDDQIDNDGDSMIDMLDPQCASPSDDRERSAVCGIGFELALILPALRLLRGRRRLG